MRTLICGSMAYDTIMVFHDRFKNHILPDQLHILNVAFHVPDMRREYGGERRLVRGIVQDQYLADTVQRGCLTRDLSAVHREHGNGDLRIGYAAGAGDAFRG